MNDSILSSNYVFLDIEAANQKEVFEKIAKIAEESGIIKKGKILIKDFIKRETESSTGFGGGFAIPHARNKKILKTGVFFLRLKRGVEWNALDEQPVNIIIGLAVPLDKAADVHLELLSKIAQKITKEEVQELLKKSTNKNEIIKCLIN